MPYRVLVVEDDATTAVFTKGVLKQLGYEVTAVTSTAADGIKEAEAGLPHVVIMDISLGAGMSGIQAGDWIRQNLDIPVIFVTAHSDESTLRQAQAVEPYGFVLKPFDKNDLRVAIEIALTKHRIDSRLRWSQRRFATTLKAIGDAVISTDAKGSIDFMNGAAEQLIGVPLAEVLGKPLGYFVNLIDPQDRNPVELNESWKSDALLINAAGSEIPVTGSIAGISNESKVGAGQVLVLRDITEERRLAELRERQRAQKIMAEVSEAERRRFGQDLHDGLGQMLTGIAFLCKKTEANLAGRSQPEAGDVAEIGKLLRNTIECTREIARGLLPVPARPEGLVMALERLADQMTSHSGIDCSFSASSAIVIADPAKATHLFRIVQEAVNNALKHAGATHIDIFLTNDDDSASISIKDDGHGIPADRPMRGSGIEIMRHRASAVEGTLDIATQVGAGTNVTCHFPLTV
jgi:two-component system sensor kinase FixL